MDRSKLSQVQLQAFHPEHSEVSLPVKLLQMATSLGDHIVIRRPRLTFLLCQSAFCSAP